MLSRTTFYGFAAWRLESEAISLVVVAEAGAKIVSLVHKPSGREWLITPEQSNPFRLFPPGAEYNPNQPGGWDEMIPTIIACPYPAAGPFEGAALADHGEAWTLAWDDDGSGDDGIRLSMLGQALPYRLRRTLSLSAPDEVLFDYSLENLGRDRFIYLWAAHPQLACDPGAVIILPPEVSEVVNVLPLAFGPEFGPPGTHNPWPELPTPDGVLRQDVVRSVERKGGRKFYLPPEQAIAWAELRQPSGEWLRMGWEPMAAAYFGVWIDEGFLNRVAAVALEPTTGYYDDLSLAWRNRRLAELQPGEVRRWQLRVRLGK